MAGPPEGFYWEARLHLVAPLGGDAGLQGDARGHLGLGSGLALGYALDDTHRLRAVVDYAGLRLTTVPAAQAGPTWDGGDLSDLFRTLRLGLEHQVALPGTGRWRAFYGGGVQNTWVARAEDTFARVVGLAVAEALGFIQTEPVNTLTRGSALDAWFPYGTLGLGLEGTGHAFAEVRVVVGNYRRWRGGGLSATPHGAMEDRLGTQLVLTVGYRSW